MYEWGSSTMLNPTSAPCDERLFLSAVSDAMRPMLLAPMERPRSQSTLCYGAKQAQDTPLPSRRWIA